MKTKDAVKVITESLKSDPAYRASWVANLSMTCYDSAKEHGIETDKAIASANKTAEDFIELLTK